MKVLPSHTGEVTAARDGQAASASTAEPTRSFASVLASSTTPATVPGTDVSPTATTAPATTAAPSAINLRKGEAMTAVNGHSYAEIHGGKRDGLYVNTSNNKRRGQAFVLVHRNGREYHIYGHGKNRLVVALRKPEHADAQKKPATDTQTTAAAGTGGATAGTTPTVSAS
jgi:hypothetical protein